MHVWVDVGAAYMHESKGRRNEHNGVRVIWKCQTQNHMNCFAFSAIKRIHAINTIIIDERQHIKRIALLELNG